MTACPKFSHLLVIPHLHVQNANAVSSPLTHGFPSMTAFLGLMWALERKARAAGMDLRFKAVGVVCHDHHEQTTEGGFVKSFHLTRNPVGKDGKPTGIVEEGRIHLELSLLLAVDGEFWSHEPDAVQSDACAVADMLASMRIAGGSLLSPAQPWRHKFRPYVIDLTGTEDDQRAVFRKARMRLLPGFTLVSREDSLAQRLSDLQSVQPEANPLDAWLSLSRSNWHFQLTDQNDKGAWVTDRRGKGWIVPIPVGYGALGEIQSPGTVANARDSTSPFRFVESLYSIGEWISPHRLQLPRQMLWYTNTRSEEGLYQCRNDYGQTRKTESSAFEFEFDLG